MCRARREHLRWFVRTRVLQLLLRFGLVVGLRWVLLARLVGLEEVHLEVVLVECGLLRL